MLACYGPASAAKEVIGKVNRMHGKVKGETPAGDKYRAMDPLLLDWVAATASYGFLMAYDRFVHPVSEADKDRFRSEEHTSELQSLMRISYAVFCLKKKTNK